MTRKTNGQNSTATASRVASSLRSLRSHIDKLDLHILKLVNERASLAAEIGRLKNDHGNEVFSPAREEEVLQQVLDANKGPLDAGTIRAIYREIMSGSRALQLGPGAHPPRVQQGAGAVAVPHLAQQEHAAGAFDPRVQHLGGRADCAA